MRRAVFAVRSAGAGAVPRALLSTEHHLTPEKKQSRLDALKKLEGMSKDEFLKFAEEMSKQRDAKRGKQMSSLEDAPVAVRALLAPEAEKDWTVKHPYWTAKWAQLTAASWKSADVLYDGPLNEFKQPVKSNKRWLEWIQAFDGEWIDDLCMVEPRMGLDKCTVDIPYLHTLFAKVLTLKGMNAKQQGKGYVQVVLQHMYDAKFNFDVKPDEGCWNFALKACVLQGEWRTGYLIEDVMRASKMTPDPAALKRIDEIAFEAHEKGYLWPPSLQGHDINAALTVKTVGGVGAYVPPPQGESWGFELWRYYDGLKAGTAAKK